MHEIIVKYIFIDKDLFRHYLTFTYSLYDMSTLKENTLFPCENNAKHFGMYDNHSEIAIITTEGKMTEIYKFFLFIFKYKTIITEIHKKIYIV